VDLRAQAQRHPAPIAGLGLTTAAGLLAIGYAALSSYRRSRQPAARLERQASSWADELGRRWERAREAVPSQLTARNKKGEEMAAATRKPGLIKNLLWMGLTAATVALFGLLARRVSSGLWETVMREPPPTSKV
jgi:hypothetical protein